MPPHPALITAASERSPGTALDAGSGEGTEALWLAGQGWRVTAVDISAAALSRAAAGEVSGAEIPAVRWVEADLTTWEPAQTFDLVTTHYAHPQIPQLDFYERISRWVAPGGTLLIVGHLASPNHQHHYPSAATADADGITARLVGTAWELVRAEEGPRNVTAPNGRTVELHDVVVQARRLPID